MLNRVNDVPASAAEMLLRALARGEDSSLRAVLARSPCERMPSLVSSAPLSEDRAALVHLGALLAGGGSTTSLRWAAEKAFGAGVGADEIIEVLVIVAAAVGSARVVEAAPRLALAIGYDIEVDGWDGD